MAIYSLWIFDRHSNCIYSREWDNKSKSSLVNVNNAKDTAKLLFGTIFSMKNISQNLSKQNKLKSFSTLRFKCHFKETGSGLKFCLLTDPELEDMQFLLDEIYTSCYVNHVVKNALSPVDFRAGQVIGSEPFTSDIDRLVVTLPSFST
ncbi:unnamed protein product [Kuraishia capsulata CBS 1993]|uniref:Trafficking protein particle complex subunit n=1 Tax=Kuraishia capsulata CBS 1993 TaxID=1382522 RepID=W6MHC7_9ASCO|nr:uncharacterized protein KUCA_T00001340001 [Kuraishia capsulata CBS 1993]CDK25371.1 unnamed protein product [Kuraishia capsulata CBS 1993]